MAPLPTRLTLPTLLTQAIIALNTFYPLVAIHVTLDTSDWLAALLKDGSLDVAIARMQANKLAEFSFQPGHLISLLDHPTGQGGESTQ